MVGVVGRRGGEFLELLELLFFSFLFNVLDNLLLNVMFVNLLVFGDFWVCIVLIYMCFKFVDILFLGGMIGLDLENGFFLYFVNLLWMFRFFIDLFKVLGRVGGGLRE